MIPVGGKRARLVRDSFFYMVRDALQALGWFDATVSEGGQRRHLPINLVEEDVSRIDEMPFNTLAVFSSDVADEEAEMGSALTDDNWLYYVDFYAENDAVGEHLIHDVRDILRGKFPSIGRTASSFEVFDWSQATPVPLGYCQIQNVRSDRAQTFNRPWQSHWFVVRCEVEDSYADEEDVVTP